jgi:hypothetical protein
MSRRVINTTGAAIQIAEAGDSGPAIIIGLARIKWLLVITRNLGRGSPLINISLLVSR